jgi:diguanylate cyclase (GGDEF)-like protein
VNPSLTPTQRRVASVVLDALAVACLLALIVATGDTTILWIDAAYAAIAAGVLVRPGGISSVARAVGATAAIAGLTAAGVPLSPPELAHAGLMLAMAFILGAHVEWQHRAGTRDRSAVAAARTQGGRTAEVIDIAGEFTASLDLEHVLARFAQRTRGLFDAASIELSWLDAENDSLVMLVEWIDDSPVVTTHGGGVYPLVDYPLTRRVLSDLAPAQVRVADPAADPAERALLEEQDLGSLLMMPLLWNGLTIGLVEVVDRGDRVFTDEEIGLCAELARLAAAAIYNAMTFERTRETSLRDPATGLHNRRHFDERLRAELNRAERAGGRVALVLLDVDGLKKVNDSLGHQAGDALLYAAAEALRRVVRDSDSACRLGGDEFGIILPEADAEAARSVTERVRRGFSGAGGAGHRFSAGVAVYPLDATDADALCRAADAAAYASKSAGGGCTTVARHPPMAA